MRYRGSYSIFRGTFLRDARWFNQVERGMKMAQLAARYNRGRHPSHWVSAGYVGEIHCLLRLELENRDRPRQRLLANLRSRMPDARAVYMAMCLMIETSHGLDRVIKRLCSGRRYRRRRVGQRMITRIAALA